MLSRVVQRVFTVACALSLLTACTGAEGPAGPPGPEGPQGPPGSFARSTFFVVIDETGYAEQGLPLAFGDDPSLPPGLNCYITEVRSSGVWQPVADGFTATDRTVCGLVFDEGRWFAVILDGPPTWTVAFSVTEP